MNSELPEVPARYLRRFGEVLHYAWDPIGVAGCPQARDEYDSYLQSICRLVMGGADAKVVANHLTQVVTDAMGLSANRKKDLEVAGILIEWHQELSRGAA